MLNAKGIDLNSTFEKGLGYDTNNLDADAFGVEVELEGLKVKTEKDAITKWWATHVDNSLRVNKPGAQATEYVFRKPFNLDDTRFACKALFDFLNTNPGTVVFPSYRTSIHVHVNCLKETVRTVVNFITLAIIFDELLVSQNGETRIGNNFCLRSKDAEGQVADLVMSVSQYGSLYNISQQHRYSATNFASLLKFGTVEFRSLECTTDLQRLLDWIDILQGLKEAARQYQDPREIIAKFSRRGPLGFMVTHLGDHATKYAAVPGAHQMLQNGMRLAQDFAYCSEWKQSEAVVNKPRRKSKYDDIVFQQQPQWAQPAVPDPVHYNQMLQAVAQQQAHWAQPPAPLGQAIPMPGPMHAIDQVIENDVIDDDQVEVDWDAGMEPDDDL